MTGSHRSGTTWLAYMLALAEGTLLAHEPFNIEPWAYSLGGVAKQWFAYAPGLPRDAALEAFDAFLQGRTRKAFLKNQPQYWLPPLRRGRLVIKDPIAALSSDWLAHNYDLEVVVLVRYPVAFAASLKRLGWKYPFGHFLEQDDLMREHLEPYREEMASKPQDVVDQAALLWKCLYGVLFTYLGRNPDWRLRKHEVLCGDPVGGLKGLYDSLGLRWTKRVEDGVLKHTQGGNPASAPPRTVHHLQRDSAASVCQWKTILTTKEVARVLEVTRPVVDLYYPDGHRDGPSLGHLPSGTSSTTSAMDPAFRS